MLDKELIRKRLDAMTDAQIVAIVRKALEETGILYSIETKINDNEMSHKDEFN